MKRIMTIALGLLAALSAAPLTAGEPCGCCTTCTTCPSCTSCSSCGCSSCGCAEECCSENRWAFHIDRVETRYKVEVDTHKWYATPSKTTEVDQPCQRMVSVTVVDPCTGCKHIEQRMVNDVQKVKTTCIDILPVDECKPKTEEKVKVCTTITMDCRPVMEAHKAGAPAPAPAAAPAPLPVGK